MLWREARRLRRMRQTQAAREALRERWFLEAQETCRLPRVGAIELRRLDETTRSEYRLAPFSWYLGVARPVTRFFAFKMCQSEFPSDIVAYM